jgi:hypothetical protein
MLAPGYCRDALINASIGVLDVEVKSHRAPTDEILRSETPFWAAEATERRTQKSININISFASPHVILDWVGPPF